MGLLSHPVVSQAFQKYLLSRQSQILAGKKVPVSAEDFKQTLERKIWFDDRQVARKYMRHAPQLGIMENYSPANAEQFKMFIQNHVMNPNTELLPGTYRGTIPAVHYYDPKTNINVVTLQLENGKFHTAWPLTQKQLYHLYKTGDIQ